MSARPCRCTKATPDGVGIVCWGCLEDLLNAKARREEWELDGMIPPVLTVEDSLAAFDRWNDGNPGPAYGAVMCHPGHVSLEGLTKAVLVDRGINPERWQVYTGIVERAFKEWLQLDAPYVPPTGPDPSVEESA